MFAQRTRPEIKSKDVCVFISNTSILFSMDVADFSMFPH